MRISAAISAAFFLSFFPVLAADGMPVLDNSLLQRWLARGLEGGSTRRLIWASAQWADIRGALAERFPRASNVAPDESQLRRMTRQRPCSARPLGPKSP